MKWRICRLCSFSGGDLSRSLKGAVKEMPRSETPVRVWNTRLRCNQSERVGYKYTCGVSSCDGAGGKFHPVNIRLSNSIPPTRYHPSLFMWYRHLCLDNLRGQVHPDINHTSPLPSSTSAHLHTHVRMFYIYSTWRSFILLHFTLDSFSPFNSPLKKWGQHYLQVVFVFVLMFTEWNKQMEVVQFGVSD